mmetsp:Transcript_10802/g.36347  ORF Transcript_10802/g.36347 Transcript_10802/m.36347 type:complete len:140 (+) Transcript_10802:306-725(+)
MASFRPGVGDPLSSENPFSDGRPNWRLQTKTRTCKPPDMLGTGLQVDQPKVSPYTTEFSDLYKNHQASTQLVVKKQMRHFDHHLVQTTVLTSSVDQPCQTDFSRIERDPRRRPSSPRAFDKWRGQDPPAGRKKSPRSEC